MDTPRIYTRCPACHNDTLTVNEDKHLLCTWIECPSPTMIDQVDTAIADLNRRLSDRTRAFLTREVEFMKRINKAESALKDLGFQEYGFGWGKTIAEEAPTTKETA